MIGWKVGGIMTSKVSSVCWCGKSFVPRALPGKACSHAHSRPGPRGTDDKFIDANGYVRVRTFDDTGKIRWRYEHRVIGEATLKRPMKRWETVHHVDGDKANNRRNNLVICSLSYHQEVFHSKRHDL